MLTSAHITVSLTLTSMASGLTAFLVIRMWFGKAVEDFNAAISKQGNDAPQLIASTSNGFTSECIHFLYCFFSSAYMFLSGLGRICFLRRSSHMFSRETQRDRNH